MFRKLAALGLVMAGILAAVTFTQQGSKLLGTGGLPPSAQGTGVALSSDGTTALVGASSDGTSNPGAVWAYTRSGTTWTQQQKIVGSATFKQIGNSVALSSDGNTALISEVSAVSKTGAARAWTRSGGTWTLQQALDVTGAGSLMSWCVALSSDGNTGLIGVYSEGTTGAAWVWTRSAGTWTMQQQLIGTGATGNASQGFGCALSSDGNTALVGGFADNSSVGAVWAWTRSGGTWTQQQKMVGTGGTTPSNQGRVVALSSDGNTALWGGYSDNSGVGSAWVWTRSGGTWTQQQQLIGTGATGNASQGIAVSLAGDGNTALIGGYTDNTNVGAVWIWTRTGSTWTQQQKIIGTGGTPSSSQGRAVALSTDGNTALIGAQTDNTNVGAAWVWVSGLGGGGSGRVRHRVVNR
jgi:hypothetical protein